ncbi:glycoside hydrolase family 2 protein [Chitinophaga niabensis]|nr:glycoside hydrolase family 2 TIM barrel-domain containing protein [Chitinophaga niabensis]
MKFIISLLSLPAMLPAQDYMAGGRKALAPVPVAVSGMKQPVISLNGTWEISLDANNWKQVLVPGEPVMQGVELKHDQPFNYRRKLTIPADAAGKTLAIRFNGVYSYARVWVNGHFIREHYGGFTAWECDITPYVQPGKEAELKVEVTDRLDDISFASGYAHHPIGGILREVQLIARPSVHIQRLYAHATLVDDLKNGELALDILLNTPKENVTVACTLTSPDGKKITFPQGGTRTKLINPEPWTAERPRLYRLDVAVTENGKITEKITQQIGFRKVEISNDKQLLVNGKPVKLRGACRHDMHPLLGRSTNRQQDSLDVILAKEANLNFIRTSHYPPSQDFLEFCDRYGIYVQEETAICFVGQDRGGEYNKHTSTQNDTAYTSRYLGQLSEMIDRDRNHAAIIMWSIGNESNYGANFQQEYDFVKRTDASRPVSWSWPGTALKDGKRCFDIAVSHYPVYSGKGSDMGGTERDMVHPDYPVLGDEWAHVACYNTDLLKYDPNVKDYWGRSLDTMWLNRFDVRGNIGGAIWGMIDETFHTPAKVTGYGPWGFIDVWRRKKAEFWNTKKAYSPVRILQTHFSTAEVLKIPVKNRFDHTSLSAVSCKLTAEGKTTTLKLPAIAPHEEGMISLNVKQYRESSLLLQFFDERNNLIDEEKITWGTRHTPQEKMQKARLTIDENGEQGTLSAAIINGVPVMTGMPEVAINRPEQGNAFKNTAGNFSENMKISGVNVTRSGDKTIYHLKGQTGNYPVSLSVTLFPTGLVEVKYEADSIPRHTWEIGIKIPVSAELNRIEWDREGYWTTYPEGHLSATQGKADRKSGAVAHYREKPSYNIAQSTTDYYLAGTTDDSKASVDGTEAYRAKKENIYSFILGNTQKKGRIRVISAGDQAAKMNIDADGKQWLVISDKWDYWSLSWGNYQGTVNRSKKVSGTVRFIIEE